MNEALKTQLAADLVALLQYVLAQQSPDALTLAGFTPAQLAVEILKGTAENANKLAGRTLNEIVALATGGSETAASVKLALDDFIARRDNPNVVTKTQVQLGSVQNYPIATDQEASDGVSTTTYVTPSGVSTRVTRAVNALVGQAPTTMNTLEKIALILGNDPQYFANVVLALNSKLGVDEVAGDSAKLGGVSAQDYASAAALNQTEDNLLSALQTVALEVNADYIGTITVGSVVVMGDTYYGYREPTGASPMGTVSVPTFKGAEIVQITWRDTPAVFSMTITGDQTGEALDKVLLDGVFLGTRLSFTYQSFADETTAEFDITGLLLPTAGTFNLYF